MLTKQELFDTCAIGIITQGVPAMNQNGGCLYRLLGRDATGACTTLKCAIGHLIPDDRYEPSFENDPFPDILRTIFPVEYEVHGYVFFSHLQRAHDGAARNSGLFLDGYRRRMRDIAHAYSLDPNALRGFSL